MRGMTGLDEEEKDIVLPTCVLIIHLYYFAFHNMIDKKAVVVQLLCNSTIKQQILIVVIKCDRRKGCPDSLGTYLNTTFQSSSLQHSTLPAPRVHACVYGVFIFGYPVLTLESSSEVNATVPTLCFNERGDKSRPLLSF